MDPEEGKRKGASHDNVVDLSYPYCFLFPEDE